MIKQRELPRELLIPFCHIIQRVLHPCYERRRQPSGHRCRPADCCLPQCGRTGVRQEWQQSGAPGRSQLGLARRRRQSALRHAPAGICRCGCASPQGRRCSRQVPAQCGRRGALRPSQSSSRNCAAGVGAAAAGMEAVAAGTGPPGAGSACVGVTSAGAPVPANSNTRCTPCKAVPCIHHTGLLGCIKLQLISTCSAHSRGLHLLNHCTLTSLLRRQV